MGSEISISTNCRPGSSTSLPNEHTSLGVLSQDEADTCRQAGFAHAVVTSEHRCIRLHCFLADGEVGFRSDFQEFFKSPTKKSS